MENETGAVAERGLARRRTIAGFRLTEFHQPPLRRLPMHEHRDASLCFVLAGDYREQVGSRTRECRAHAVVLKPAGARHSDEFGREGGRCLLIEIDPVRLPLLEGWSDPATGSGMARSAALAALGHRLHGEFTTPDSFSGLAVEGLTLELMAAAGRALSGEPRCGAPRWLGVVVEQLRDDAGLPTLRELARSAGVHPSHLSRTFRRHYRMSVGQYLRRVRVEQAARAVAESARPLAEIAVAAGFFDQSHFSRAFKAQLGVTPREYRRARRVSTLAART